MIAFTKVKLPYGWMSNMSSHKVFYVGLEWKTTEHLFQALRFEDTAIQEAIRTHRSPMVAKFYAKKRIDLMTIKPQSPQDQMNMYKVLNLKVDQNPELLRQLLETDDDLIVEDVTKRPHGSGKFWGAALESGKWIGDNVLGKMWMLIRSERRQLCKHSSQDT